MVNAKRGSREGSRTSWGPQSVDGYSHRNSGLVYNSRLFSFFVLSADVCNGKCSLKVIMSIHRQLEVRSKWRIELNTGNTLLTVSLCFRYLLLANFSFNLFFKLCGFPIRDRDYGQCVLRKN